MARPKSHRSPNGLTCAWDAETGEHRPVILAPSSSYWQRGRHAAPPKLDPVRAFILAAAMLSTVQLLPAKPRRRRRPALVVSSER